MKKKWLFFLVATVVLTSCAHAPRTFYKTFTPTWATIEWKDDIKYEDAWKNVMDILIRNFDIEVAQKDNGYIRTGWVYTWTGKYTDYYRVRVTVKFEPEKRSLDLKSEAYYRDYVGYDTRLLETVKSDIMGTIGRRTR